MKPNLPKSILIFLVLMAIVVFTMVKLVNIKIPEVPGKIESTTRTTTRNIFDPHVDENVFILKFSDIDYLLLDCCSSVISEANSKRLTDRVLVKGKAKFPYPSNLEIRLNFEIIDEKLVSKINFLRIGKIESPSFLEEKLSRPLQKAIDDKINKNFRFKDVKITPEGLNLKLK